jgi:glyoxylase-like metal-dependent hydrolase (beta-lactamase superfamily II)
MMCRAAHGPGASRGGGFGRFGGIVRSNRKLVVSAAIAALAVSLATAAPEPARAADAPQTAASSRAGAAVDLYAPDAQVYARQLSDGQIHPWHLQGEIWLLAGEPRESNVAVQIGNDGVLVVDTGEQATALKLLAQILQLAREHAGDQKAIRFVINTNGVADHIGGNQVIREAGSTIAGAQAGAGFRFDTGDAAGIVPGASVIANQNVLTRLVAESAAGVKGTAQPLWPTDTEDFDLYNWWFNGEAVRLFHPHSANTDGQLMVQFRRSDVIAAGDIIDTNSYPLIDVARGGSVDGELVALHHLIDLAVPAGRQEGGTVVVPGHGKLCDQSDVVHYANMVTIIRNRVQYYKNRGKTLQQVLALGVTSDYDERWGSSEGPWTTQDFVTAVYNTLPKKGPSFSMLNTALVPAPSGAVPGVKMY